MRRTPASVAGTQRTHSERVRTAEAAVNNRGHRRHLGLGAEIAKRATAMDAFFERVVKAHL